MTRKCRVSRETGKVSCAQINFDVYQDLSKFADDFLKFSDDLTVREEDIAKRKGGRDG